MNPPQMLWLEDDPGLAVATAIRELSHHNVVLFPTDTVYGLLANYNSETAYHQIFRIKHREPGKPLQLLAAPQSDAATDVRSALGQATNVLSEFNAGRATVILSAELLPRLPGEVLQIQPGAVGIRCTPSSAVVQVLCGLNAHRLAWATSANRAAGPPLSNHDAAIEWLAHCEPKPACAVISRKRLQGQPSAVYQFTSPDNFEQLR